MKACEVPTSRHPLGRTGTSAGYWAHQRGGEPVCDPCREAYRGYVRKAQKGETLTQKTLDKIVFVEGVGSCPTPSTKYPQGRTGTVAGLFLHRRHKEVPCVACLKADAERVRSWKKRNGWEPKPVTKTKTKPKLKPKPEPKPKPLSISLCVCATDGVDGCMLHAPARDIKLSGSKEEKRVIMNRVRGRRAARREKIYD